MPHVKCKHVFKNTKPLAKTLTNNLPLTDSLLLFLPDQVNVDVPMDIFLKVKNLPFTNVNWHKRKVASKGSSI